MGQNDGNGRLDHDSGAAVEVSGSDAPFLPKPQHVEAVHFNDHRLASDLEEIQSASHLLSGCEANRSVTVPLYSALHSPYTYGQTHDRGIEGSERTEKAEHVKRMERIEYQFDPTSAHLTVRSERGITCSSINADEKRFEVSSRPCNQ